MPIALLVVGGSPTILRGRQETIGIDEICHYSDHPTLANGMKPSSFWGKLLLVRTDSSRGHNLRAGSRGPERGTEFIAALRSKPSLDAVLEDPNLARLYFANSSRLKVDFDYTRVQSNLARQSFLPAEWPLGVNSITKSYHYRL